MIKEEADGMGTLKRRHGFTLVEIMVVVIILGLLASLVVPRVLGQGEEARRTAAKVQLQEIAQALDLFHLDNGFYPTTDQGVKALVEKPASGPTPTKYRAGGYLKKMPADPWGRPYLYRCPGEHGDYDLLSPGPDGKEGGTGKDGDITSWE